jgi:acyl-CoA synthetase (NDP forming)
MPAGRRIGLLSVSGGGGVLMADDCEAHGLEVPELPAAVQTGMKEVIPYAGVTNPVDITAQVLNEPERYGEFLDLMLAEGGFDAFVVFFAHLMSYAREFGITMAEQTARAARQSGKPFVMVALRDECAATEILAAAGIPIFEDPSRAVAAVAALAHYAERRPALLARLDETAAIDRTPIAPEPVATEDLAKAFLARHGLAVTREAVAGNADEAASRAAEIGFPVALKVLSPEIQHKTEVGGVELGLADTAAVRAGYEAIVANTGVARVLVQEMAAGLELILGLKRDLVFGPMVLCGLGGIHAEVMRDVALRHAPVDHATAGEMLQDLAGYALLEGSRGADPCDIQAVIEAIVTLSRLGARADWIEELDINPLMVGPRGRGCLVADALIVRESP